MDAARPISNGLWRRRGNLSLGYHVRYLGPKRLEELVHEIESCDVGIIPNHRNTFTEINTPTRIFEYLALGKPVVAPRTLGIQDYFSPDALLFFESGNRKNWPRKSNMLPFMPRGDCDCRARAASLSSALMAARERDTLESGGRTSSKRLVELSIAGFSTRRHLGLKTSARCAIWP